MQALTTDERARISRKPDADQNRFCDFVILIL